MRPSKRRSVCPSVRRSVRPSVTLSFLLLLPTCTRLRLVLYGFFFNVAHKGVDVDVANFFGLREVNLALNVLLLVALIAVLATIIETRIQIIERIGNYH